jgi:hypothetical protein
VREPELKELQGASRLARGFFNRLIRRIECTKPVAGSNISIVQQDDGFKISAGSSSSSTYPAVTFNVVTINVIALQVCSGGSTQTVYVLSTTNSNAITMLKSATTAPLQVLIPNKN